MKEIKFLLTVFGSAAYTSLWWAVIVFDGIPAGPENIHVGTLALILYTLAILIGSILYLQEHWQD
jgi:hypothetical protein